MGKKNKKNVKQNEKLIFKNSISHKTEGFTSGLVIGVFITTLLLLFAIPSTITEPVLNTSFVIEPGQNGTISTAIGQSSIFRAGNITKVLVANLTGYLAINVSLLNSSQTVMAVLLPHFKNQHNLQQYYLPIIGITNGTYTFATLNQTEGTLIYPVIANETIEIKLYNYYYTPIYGSIRINEIGKRA
ncbi:MAG: hypothetical protein QW575_04475 [Thermoproteota archaeon]